MRSKIKNTFFIGSYEIHYFSLIFLFVLYISSDHRQRTVLRSIEQGWEGLSMKQDHQSNSPTDEPQGTISRMAPQMNNRVPSVEQRHK